VCAPASGRETDDHAARASGRGLEHAHVAGRPPAERQPPVGADVRGLRCDQRIGRGQHGPRAVAEAREQLALRARDVLQRSQRLQVGRRHVRDDADRGLGDLRQRRDLAARPHGHLQHPGGLVAGRAQDCQRHAHVGVQIPGRSQNGAQRRERSGAQLLRRRLPVRAGDRHDQAAILRARRAGERTERAPRIVDGDHRRVGAAGRRSTLARDDDAGRTGRDRGRREVEAVDALAREREEELAGDDRSIVGRRARKGRSARARLHDRAAHRARRPVDRSRRGRRHDAAASAAAASSRSSKWCLVVPRI
jgi:hypothetical protein